MRNNYQITRFTVFLFVVLCLGCTTKTQRKLNTNISAFIKATNDIPVYNFDELKPLLYTNGEKTRIINFWAMWCAPCVEELPHFQQYANEYPNVEVVLVSLDFSENIESKLKPFLRERNIDLKVVLLDDPDANTWIDEVNENWSGAIPFTIILNKENRQFYERSFESFEDLEKEINEINY